MLKKLSFVGCLLGLPVLLAAAPAQAGIDACGDINVRAKAECTVEVEGGCKAKCEPINMRAACTGKAQVECEGECDIDVDVSCTASCELDCQAECKIDPPKFDCRGRCEAEASADCSGTCSSSGNKSECEASCKANASAECSASCTVDPTAEAQCEASCRGGCQGECKAKANAECQVECQGELVVNCEAELKGGCEVACQKPEGALFCDGQYVDDDGNLEECIAAIEAAIDGEVSYSASGSCKNGRCEGEAEASASCAFVPGESGSSHGALGLLAVGLAGMALHRRRRRN